MTTTTTGPGGRIRASFVCDSAGTTLIIRIRGEIDHHTAADIRKGVDALLYEKRPARLLLDLSAVSFMDSSGLGLIMGRLALLRELGGALTVWDPSPETRRIITLAGLERLVRIEYPSGAPSAVGAGDKSVEAPPVPRRRSTRPRAPGRTNSRPSPRKEKEA